MDTLGLSFSIKSLDDAGLIEGLAAGFGNVDHGGDMIMPGAFAKSLASRAGRAVPMLNNHDQGRPIGVWTELRETGEGLAAKGRIITSTRDGADAHALARAGAMGGLSIGYGVDRHVRTTKARELHELTLHEVSLVAVPMNDRARISAVKAIGNVRDIEEMLHDGGMSGRKAKRAAEAAWKAINEAEDEAVSPALAALFKQSAARIAGK